MAFKLPDLDYSYDSLEPYIDSKTMEIHYGKHHAGYTANLNNAIQGTEMENHSINQILENLDMNNSALRNNGGGFFNHCLYWEIMGPNCGGTPSGDLLNSITDNFDSFENFKSSSYFFCSDDLSLEPISYDFTGSLLKPFSSFIIFLL